MPNKPRRSSLSKPLTFKQALLTVATFLIVLAGGAFAYWKYQTARTPSLPGELPAYLLQGLSERELNGAAVFRKRNCRTCHQLGDSDAGRGPELTEVGGRMKKEKIVTKVAKGGRGMPGYQETLAPDEFDALIAFLLTLKPRDDAAMP